jgi:hypothetical protein
VGRSFGFRDDVDLRLDGYRGVARDCRFVGRETEHVTASTWNVLPRSEAMRARVSASVLFVVALRIDCPSVTRKISTLSECMGGLPCVGKGSVGNASASSIGGPLSQPAIHRSSSLSSSGSKSRESKLSVNTGVRQ